jgi:aryl carrier-like protein
VAQGYWGRPEETAATFGARLADGSGPFLRTGDLGFRQDGHLVVTGRIKDLMIVRGRNHYPQDLELAAERADPALRPGCSVAFLADPDAGDDDLVLVHEVRRDAGTIDADAVAARIRQAVAAEHGLQVRTVVLIRAGGMPKTSSGKVQRRLCRTRFLAGELPVVGRSQTAPGTGRGSADAGPEQVFDAAPADRRAAVERYLRARVADLVGPGALGPDDPLLAAGLDSLAVVQLKHRIDADLGVELALPVVLGGATFGALAELLAGQIGDRPDDRAAPPLRPALAADTPTGERVVPLSEAQRRMWFLQRVEPKNTAYTIAVAVRSADAVDGPALRRALDAVVARHSALRTTFDVRDGEPVQIVRPDGATSYEEHDASGFDDKTLTPWLTRATRQPFDLAAGPLLRLTVFRRADGDVLLLVAHHIVVDFQSLIVLARELGAYYTAFAAGRPLTLPAPRADYGDFVAWQRAMLADPDRAESLAAYWDGVVGAGVPRLTPLPLLGKTSARGGSHAFALPPALAAGLRERAAGEKTTLFVLLLAGFQALLHGLTGRPDLAVGVNTAARSRPEFDDVVGLCTNPVLIRSTTADDEPFRDLLTRAREAVIGALEHQDYPMTLVAARHKIRRATLADALFTVNRSLGDGDDLAAVAFLGPPGAQRCLGALRVERFPLPAAPAAVPVELAMADVSGVPQGLLRYRGDALDAATAEQFVQRYLAVLAQIAADPAVPVGALCLTAPAA